MAEFYHRNQTIKEFSAARRPYHFEQAHMYKELIEYLRSTESRNLSRPERQAYARVRIVI